MALNIKNEKAEALARQVSAITGENITQTIVRALEERLERLRGRRAAPTTHEAIMEISRRSAALPDQDTRTADEILGYDDRGTFG
jgi:antitoxin VapB